MRFTLAWLKEYLDFKSSPEALCEKLTSLGLEVESYKNPKRNLIGFIVSEITDISPHPNADKLQICEVNNGTECIKIVCGANNVKKKMKTVLATIGSIVKPGTKDEFVIGKSKIRGVESNGMLCSEEELNLSEESEGIMELNQSYKIGDAFSNYLDDENIEIEIAITPNRVDCAGVYGIARDLSASGFGKLKEKKISKSKVNFPSPIKLNNKLKKSGCPQFLLRAIRNVENKQSPEDIIKRFNQLGLKVISSLVDVTNFLTVDYCRPLHVFDLDKIEGDIEIRYSKKGEKFLGLDENEYVLDDHMIVICDEKKIISLAGVLGGKNTGCDENTKNVLLESAYFKPEDIALTGRKLNIISDARYRFERGIDPCSTEDGIEIATEMIIKNCGGEVGSIVNDSEKIIVNEEIEIETNFFSRILGYEIDEKTIFEKLRSIGCRVEKKKGKIFVKPPSWRPDISIKEDLVEEMGRLLGYERIPSKPFNLIFNAEVEITSLSQKIRKQIRELLVSRNIMETISWSFSREDWEKQLNNDNQILEIANPISAELSCLRSNLLGGLLSLIKKNNKKDIQNISVFEIGPIFNGTKPGEQIENLAVVRSGKAIEKHWASENRNYDIFDIKSDLFSVLKLFNLPSNKLEMNSETKDYFHPGKSGSIYIGEKKIASFGELHPTILQSFGIKNSTCSFDIDISLISSFFQRELDSKDELITSNFQSSVRDFSFEVDKKLSSSELVNHIRNIDKTIIKNVKVFDNYENENVRALAIEVKMQSEKKTLTDVDINKLSEKIISEAKKSFNAKLR
ncbi:MAG: phenylalanine--tRNA ligase subunit beta [Pseudomonadota bacterium]|nr:phenylalanine--tRNA ligase subunit beta [Pseudomonadota bacterium]